MFTNKEYIQLLEETAKHIENEFYATAIIRSSFGIEKLLIDLLDLLCMDLVEIDKQRANDLKEKWRQIRQKHGADTSIQVLKETYKRHNIFSQLTEIYGFVFTKFTSETLGATQYLRNQATHTIVPQNKADANIVRNRFVQLLIQTHRLPEGWETKQNGETETIEDTNAATSPMQSLAMSWRDKWETLITEWLKETDNLSDKVLVGSLVDLLILVNGLVSDDRVPAEYHPKLMLAISFVISSADLIPDEEGKLHTLRDDVAVLTFTLQWLLREADIPVEVLNEHWIQDVDPVETINYLGQHIRTSHHELFYDHEWRAIKPVAEHGPEALWNSNLVDSASPPDDLSNVYELIHEFEDADEWDSSWRSRINDWVRRHSNTAIADVVMLAPDLLIFTTRLLRDERISAQAKIRLLSVVTYVLTPLDLIPEALVGVVGLTDDVGALVLIGLWLTETIKVDEDILREHWPRESAPVEVLRNLHRRMSQVESIFGEHTGIWHQLRQRFFEDESGKQSIVERIRRLLRRS
ncbi:MAG: DUF1232 domain-containing protein [Chloroflexi bacterium]|nr:DUF1232 domain-containing protein [Chloroflexota bacterium]